MEDSGSSTLNLTEEATEIIETEEADNIIHTNKKKRGRPKNPLWESHFTEIHVQESGHKG